MPFRNILLACTMLALAGCGTAEAAEPDPSNPYHCGVAFSVYYGIAKSKGNESGAAVMKRLIAAAGSDAKHLPPSKRTPEEGDALARRLLKDPDEAYQMVSVCNRRYGF